LTEAKEKAVRFPGTCNYRERFSQLENCHPGKKGERNLLMKKLMKSVAKSTEKNFRLLFLKLQKIGRKTVLFLLNLLIT